ncbi:MAG: type II secretion system F family protein [Anaerolineae bacterium]
MTGLIIALIVVGLGIVVGGLVISRRSSRLIEERLGIAEEVVAAEAPGLRKSPVGDVLNRALARRGLGANLATQLARADLKITVGEFMAATVILVLVGAGLVYFLTGDLVAAAGACLLGFFAPRLYIGVVRGRRLKAFNDQLGDSINLLVNSLRAGYSILQAMEAVAQEMGPPVSTEFGRVVQEVQLGMTLEQALSHMLRRITSDDLDMMVTAINVQREVGGNLAEVLDAISHTIRERIRIKGEIRALSAQSRWSGYIVSLVPVVLAIAMYFINREFMTLLFTERCGWIMIGVAILGIILGYVVINRIVQIDV